MAYPETYWMYGVIFGPFILLYVGAIVYFIFEEYTWSRYRRGLETCCCAYDERAIEKVRDHLESHEPHTIEDVEIIKREEGTWPMVVCTMKVTYKAHPPKLVTVKLGHEMSLMELIHISEVNMTAWSKEPYPLLDGVRDGCPIEVQPPPAMILPASTGRIGSVPRERTMILPASTGRIGSVPEECTMMETAIDMHQ